ncbi:hypothetical protein GCM10022409_45460 [Hymenobacter glaciei]|uniref:Uncharacterized protein n=1 Tax=Hymenobacter glaciei TaxID=877209 RepID=A0ABP7UUQ2_9BACT
MSHNINSFSKLNEKIKAINGIPCVLEALWDGDTSGWYLYLNLYYKRRTWWFKEIFQPHLSKKALGTISLGGDIRLFSGQVPPWPEAELAKEIGKLASEKYGLTFYMPSEEPDDDCPSWDQQHLAIACGKCGKLIIPTDSAHLPKDTCYGCYLKQKSS